MDYAQLMYVVLDIGEEMLRSGAEVYRVEDSLERVFAAYGIVRTDVLAIASGIHCTVATADGQILTQTRRVRTCATDYGKVDRLNGLSRYLCEHTPPAAEIRSRLSEITNGRKESPLWLYLGHILGAGGFTVFFGGSLLDALAAALLSVPFTVANTRLRRQDMNPIVFDFVISLLFGLLAQLLVYMGLGHSAEQIMIGGIMLMIPGSLVTAAFRDMLIGDTITGSLRLSESLLTAAGIAAGFVASTMLVNGL